MKKERITIRSFIFINPFSPCLSFLKYSLIPGMKYLNHSDDDGGDAVTRSTGIHQITHEQGDTGNIGNQHQARNN